MNATENLIRGSEKNTRKSVLDRAYIPSWMGQMKGRRATDRN